MNPNQRISETQGAVPIEPEVSKQEQIITPTQTEASEPVLEQKKEVAEQVPGVGQVPATPTVLVDAQPEKIVLSPEQKTDRINRLADFEVKGLGDAASLAEKIAEIQAE